MLKFNFLLTFILLTITTSVYPNRCYNKENSLPDNALIENSTNEHLKNDFRFLIPEIICVNQIVKTQDCYANGVVLYATVKDDFWRSSKYTWKYVVTDLTTNDTIQFSYNYVSKPTQGISGDKTFDLLTQVKNSKMKLVVPLPIRNYKVTWTAWDSKGLTLTKDQYVAVKDKTPPTPLIVDIVLIKLENDVYESKAIDFDRGGCGEGCISSFDNCTPQSELYFTFTPVLPKLSENPEIWQTYYEIHGFYSFDPETGDFVNDILGYELYKSGKAHRWWNELKSSGKTFSVDNDLGKTTRVYVWDQFALNESRDDNNYGYTEVFIQLEPWEGPSIIGNVPPLNMVMQARWDEGYYSAISGDYSYAIGVYPNKTYTVSGYSNSGMLNGVTTLDLVILQKYLLGLKKMNHSQFIAADLNCDCQLLYTDLLNWKNLILHPEKYFYHSYIAINHDYIPLDSIPNSQDCEMMKIRIVDVGTENVYGVDFSAVKLGDLNSSNNGLEDRSVNNHVFTINNSHFSTGNRVVVPVYSKELKDVSGFQFSLSLNDLQFMDIISGALEIDDSEYSISDRQLLFSVARADAYSIEDGEALFYLVFEAISEGILSESMYLNNKILRPEIYHGKDLLISDLELGFNSEAFRLFQNTPNPFTDETNIGFELPVASDFDFEITDITGKVIYKINSNGQKGYNLITINNGVLPTNFTFGIYSLKTDLYSESKKLVKLK